MPVAMMLYSGATELPLGPAVPTACIVERSLGDRRLESHVLAGLKRLLPLLIDTEKFDYEVLLRAFPRERPPNDDGIREYEHLPMSTTQFIMDHFEACRDDFHGGALKKNEFYTSTAGFFFLPRDATTMINLSDPSAAAAVAALQASQQLPSPSCPPEQVTNSGVSDMYVHRRVCFPQRVTPLCMLPEWAGLWARCCAQLADAAAKLPPGRNLLAYLYSRIGVDAGTCIRGLHNAGICWGTYQDFLGSHCNAHANNLLLLPPTAIPGDEPGSKRLVS